jgi:hypothetical protein
MGKVGRYLVLFVCAGALLQLVTHMRNVESPASSISVGTSSPKAAVPLTDAEVKKELQHKAEKIAVRDMVRRTLEAMRDRKSLEVEKANTLVAGESLTACMEFSARNGFGAVDRGFAVWRIPGRKQAGVFSLENAAIWNKYCVGSSMRDQTAEAQDTLAYLRAR